MKRASVFILPALVISAVLSACGSGETTNAPVSVTLMPGVASVYAGESVQFTATIHNSTNTAVTWGLSGSGCSGAACGTIGSDGLYTAPANVPGPPTVTVRATSTADPGKSADATVTILSLADIWTWLSGSDLGSQEGVYGVKGVSSPSNMPGARVGGVSWRDGGGKLWLFGGNGWDSAGSVSQLNDLWSWDPASKEWTWVSGSNTINQAGVYGEMGVAAPSNVPGAREWAVSWADAAGKLWLFGGIGFVAGGDYGELNDLWKYDPASGEWEWVSGSNSLFQPGVYGTKGVADPQNAPGARAGAASWIGSDGKLWLFGGGGYDSAGGSVGNLNDLWVFDPGTLEWTWVSGGDTMDQAGVYGTEGVADSLNAPGGREWAGSCLDPGGGLWLFGGWGNDVSGASLYLNDLWRFDPGTRQWTWVSGSDTGDQAGSYGTRSLPAAANVPGGRYAPAAWVDPGHNLWLFGGLGLYLPSYDGTLNDLWRFDPLTSEWAWVSGDDTGDRAGSYGMRGTSALSNLPGARLGAISWIDLEGNLWLFGGHGVDSAGESGHLNDLWRYAR
jgi:N-acetylneuraminic acid mutarotase